MPLTRERRWTTFLLLIGLLMMAFPAIMLLKHRSGTPYDPIEIDIFGKAGVTITMVIGFISLKLGIGRAEQVTRNARGAARQEATELKAAIQENTAATSPNPEVIAEKVVEKVTNALPPIPPRDELRSLIQEIHEQACSKLADAAAQKVIDKLRAAGAIPENPNPKETQ